MTRDPFRALDRIDPPDQWDDIVERAGRTDAPDLPVDLDARRPQRARAVVAAAAVVALLGGGLALATADDEGADDVAAGPTTEGTRSDPCPFTLEPGPAVPALEPGTPGRPIADHALATVQHGELDGRAVEVAVGSGIQGDVGTGGTFGWQLIDAGDVWLVGQAEVAERETGAWPVCARATIAFDVTDLVGRPTDEVAATSSVRALSTEWEDEADAILGALLAELHPEAAAAPCEFTLDGDPSLPPLVPKTEGEEAPFTLLEDITDQWWSTEVDGMVVIVGVGGRGTGPIAEPPGTRWVGDEMSADSGVARGELRGNESLAASGACTDAVVHVIVPLTADEVSALEGARSEDPDPTRAQLVIHRVLDAVEVP